MMGKIGKITNQTKIVIVLEKLFIKLQTLAGIKICEGTPQRFYKNKEIYNTTLQ